MSKAFTRESDDSGADDTPSLRHPVPLGFKNYITRQGADQLRQKMEGLLQKRQALVAGRSDANREDQAPRRKLEVSIRNLQDILNSIVIADTPADRNKVGLGAMVEVRYASGPVETFRIVGVDEADPEGGSISWLSPLAKALLSRRAGDRVPFREETLDILNVRY